MEYDSELGALLAGLSQHAWGAWSEGLLAVRETCVWVIPCAHMHLTWSPLGCPCLCWKSGLLVMVCSGGSVDTGASTYTLGACAGSRYHTVIQGSRQPEAPPAGDTVVVSIAHGPALAAPVAVMSQGSSRRIGSARVPFAPCLFQPRSTPFSQNRL